MNRERKFQLLLAALVAASLATMTLVAMFAAVPAHAQEPEQCRSDDVCYEYKRYTSDSRTHHYNAVMKVSGMFDTWLFTRAATEVRAARGDDNYGDLLTSRARQLLVDCAGEDVTHADVAKAFFGWALKREIPATMGTGFAVTMFAEEVCSRAIGEST